MTARTYGSAGGGVAGLVVLALLSLTIPTAGCDQNTIAALSSLTNISVPTGGSDLGNVEASANRPSGAIPLAYAARIGGFKPCRPDEIGCPSKGLPIPVER